jgi:hypothetical protein
MTGRKAEVAALEQKIVAEAVMPAAKVGWPMARKPKSKGPVWGAAAGRSRVVTPILHESSSVVVCRGGVGNGLTR